MCFICPVKAKRIKLNPACQHIFGLATIHGNITSIHEMKAGRIEIQIDRAINQKRTVLLVLSEHSLSSDWVEHEVRTARGLEKEMGRDVLCPVPLDDSWKSSPWPKRVMEQITEYNILDFSDWKDESKFEHMFRKLIDGLELFYKG
jgi:hypothetical protein